MSLALHQISSAKSNDRELKLHSPSQLKMEDIAIIGFSLRFPQDAVSPQSFWNMIAEGRSAVSEVPADRFNIDAFYHPDPDRLDSVSARFYSYLVTTTAAI